MESVFVSYKFRESDWQVADNIKRLIRSHSLDPKDGVDLLGDALWPGVSQRTRASDALVALFLLPHDPTDHTWIRTEYDHACDSQKRVIAVVEDGFPWSDPRNKEYVKLDRMAQLQGFLKLSSTLGGWRKDAGRQVVVRLLPDAIAYKASRSVYSCQYRLIERSKPGDWVTVTPQAAVTGFGFPASGIRDNVTIEIEVKDGNRATFISATDPSSIPALLTEWKLE